MLYCPALSPLISEVIGIRHKFKGSARPEHPKLNHIQGEGGIFMAEEREKLIEETGDLALQYDMNYYG